TPPRPPHPQEATDPRRRRPRPAQLRFVAPPTFSRFPKFSPPSEVLPALRVKSPPPLSPSPGFPLHPPEPNPKLTRARQSDERKGRRWRCRRGGSGCFRV